MPCNGRRQFVSTALLAGLALILPMPTTGQSPGNAFHSGTTAVVVDVCVHTKSGTLPDGLTPDDFLVLDDGKPQAIKFFDAPGEAPIAALLLIDRSQSMDGLPLDQAKAAVTAFAETLSPTDYLSVLAFSDRTERIAGFTTQHDSIATNVDRLTATGQTALNDAIVVAVRELAAFRHQHPEVVRQVLLVLSDGEDTLNRVPFELLRDDVRRSGATIYPVSIASAANGNRAAAGYVLSTIAFDTGGRVVVPHSLDALPAAFAGIAREARQLYRLGFYARPGSGEWRQLSVRVLRDNAQSRTRSGYFAPVHQDTTR